MIDKKYLFIPLIFLFIIALPQFAYGNGLCAGENATLQCLKKNSTKLYQENFDLFWTIMNDTSNRAQQCKEQKDVVAFLSLIEIPRDGEVAEYYYENLENLCVNNTKCFLDALMKLSSFDQDRVIYLLVNPLFKNTTEISAALNKYRDEDKYKRVVELYIKTIRR